MARGQALGYGLLAAAGGITLIMLAWLAVSGAEAGGIVLGLLLLFVLAGPLAGGGLFMLSQRRDEALQEAEFTSKRRIIESDRIFRRELAAELRQLANRPALPAARINELAQALERRTYDSPEWYTTVQLSNQDTATLQRYDDLVWQRVRHLKRQADIASPNVPDGALHDLETALDQRRDLIVRGVRAAIAAPSALMRSGEPSRGTDALLNLKLDDAITYELEDFLIEGVASYFADGRTWKLVHLVPTGPGASEKWLYVGPAGMTIAVLVEARGGNPRAESYSFEDAELPRAEQGTATVDVASKGGSARGVLVTYATYRAEVRFALVENWPDGATPAHAGQITRSTDLEVWPS